jgi:transposase InsO family protein
MHRWRASSLLRHAEKLKTELVHQREYLERDAARRGLFGYTEGYYNPQRIHSAIGYITPDQAAAKSA